MVAGQMRRNAGWLNSVRSPFLQWEVTTRLHFNRPLPIRCHCPLGEIDSTSVDLKPLTLELDKTEKQ